MYCVSSSKSLLFTQRPKKFKRNPLTGLHLGLSRFELVINPYNIVVAFTIALYMMMGLQAAVLVTGFRAVVASKLFPLLDRRPRSESVQVRNWETLTMYSRLGLPTLRRLVINRSNWLSIKVLAVYIRPIDQYSSQMMTIKALDSFLCDSVWFERSHKAMWLSEALIVGPYFALQLMPQIGSLPMALNLTIGLSFGLLSLRHTLAIANQRFNRVRGLRYRELRVRRAQRRLGSVEVASIPEPATEPKQEVWTPEDELNLRARADLAYSETVPSLALPSGPVFASRGSTETKLSLKSVRRRR